MLLNPFFPLSLIKIKTLKATTLFLLVLLIKSNLLRLKGGLIGALFALILLLGLFTSTSIAVGAVVYAFKVRNKINNQDENNAVQEIETVNM